MIFFPEAKIEVTLLFWYVDAEKEYTCQKGLLVVNWTHIHNQSLAVVVYSGSLTQVAFQGKATDWTAIPPALCSCCLS